MTKKRQYYVKAQQRLTRTQERERSQCGYAMGSIPGRSSTKQLQFRDFPKERQEEMQNALQGMDNETLYSEIDQLCQEKRKKK